jgi:uridine kinase
VVHLLPSCSWYACTLDRLQANKSQRTVFPSSADPRLTDYGLLLENIRGLRAGRAVEVPIYDFKQSKRTGYTRVPVPKSRVVIIEGIYALSSRIRWVCVSVP